jgi:hypothetical protein
LTGPKNFRNTFHFQDFRIFSSSLESPMKNTTKNLQ